MKRNRHIEPFLVNIYYENDAKIKISYRKNGVNFKWEKGKTKVRLHVQRILLKKARKEIRGSKEMQKKIKLTLLEHSCVNDWLKAGLL